LQLSEDITEQTIQYSNQILEGTIPLSKTIYESSLKSSETSNQILNDLKMNETVFITPMEVDNEIIYEKRKKN